MSTAINSFAQWLLTVANANQHVRAVADAAEFQRHFRLSDLQFKQSLSQGK